MNFSEIELAEEKLRVAMLNSDTDTLDKLISPELIFTNHLGVVVSKQDDLSLHESGELKIESMHLSDMVIKLINGQAAVSVTAKIRSLFKGEAHHASFKFTRLWVRENSSCVVAVGHCSIVA